jgi:CheY-like chemotaxis protein
MSKKPKVLIVDDKESMLKMLSTLLADDYEVETAGAAREALELFRRSPADVVLTDIRMPDMDGMALLRTVKAEGREAEVILMTAYATVQQAVEAVKAGAYNYLTKPFEPDALKIALAKALERKQLREEAQILKEQVQRKYGFANIIGNSEAMQRTFELARKAAESDSTVLLTGESGTGKELFARFIHLNSKRAEGPFFAINCGAFTEELLSNELFGHEKGAFTGANAMKKGLIEMASGGTLFMEITPAYEGYYAQLPVTLPVSEYSPEVRRMVQAWDLADKAAFPLASLVMTLLAVPFAFAMGKKGALVGAGLSVALAFGYWGAFAIFRSLGYTGVLPPSLAAWAANLLFGLAGILFLFRLRT